MSYLKIVSSLIVFLLLALFVVPFAFAQTAAELEASTAIDASITPPPLPVRPLDAIKARAQQIKERAQGAKMELHADTKAKLESASGPGEKRDIMKNAVGARIDIAQERHASSSDLRHDITSLFRTHGGEIKNRFRLAISHMHNLLARIDTRLTKMTENGIDTSAVLTLRASAETAVGVAEADAQAIAEFVSTIDASSDRATVKTELQAKIKTAQASVKAAHEAVKKVVRALVALAKENMKVKARASVEASTTVETEVQ